MGFIDGSLRSVVLATLLAVVVVTNAIPLEHPFDHSPVSRLTQSAAGSNGLDYVVIIVLENHGINNIIGSPSAPFMNQLAHNYSLAQQYSAVAHPSLSNYLALLSGSRLGCEGYDGPPDSNDCTRLAWQSTNIVDSLETRGVTWKAYMEDMPSNCYQSDMGSYYVRHNPFVYFNDIVNVPSRCARIIPAGPNDSALLGDLESTSTASGFMWLTPDSCHDMHDCNVSTGDNYLKILVPQILNSTIFRAQNAALFITFDEGDGVYPSDYVYTVWAGPGSKKSYSSTTHYSHYSLLKTLEDVWGISPLSTEEHAQAGSMTEFLSSYAAPLAPQANILGLLTQPLALALYLVLAAGIVGFMLVLRAKRLKPSSKPIL